MTKTHMINIIFYLLVFLIVTWQSHMASHMLVFVQIIFVEWRYQTITWTNADLLSLGPAGTKFNWIIIRKYWSSFKKMHIKMLAYKWWPFWSSFNVLTYWGRATHICASKLTTIGSVNGFSLGRRQAIIWTNAGILLIGPLGEISVKSLSKFIYFHSIKCIWKCRQKIVVAILFRPQCVKYDYFHWVKNILSIKLGY